MVNLYDGLLVWIFKSNKPIYREKQVHRSVNKERCEFTTLESPLFALKLLATRTPMLEIQTAKAKWLKLIYCPKQKRTKRRVCSVTINILYFWNINGFCSMRFYACPPSRCRPYASWPSSVHALYRSPYRVCLVVLS